MSIKIHGKEGFDGMKKAGKLAAECLDMLTPNVQKGITTLKLNDIANKFILDNGGTPACVGYKGYKHALCTSVNHVICHGIPNERKLKNGDILNIDVTVIVDGWHGDTSRMYTIGKTSVKARRLIDITYNALNIGLNQVKPGNTTGDIGNAIEKYVLSERCSVVEEFCGHGIGKVFHDEPNILHYGEAGSGHILKEGMFFTIEPMVNLGKAENKTLSDGWTVVTRDRSLSAQFEHTIGVTKDGYEIFTLSRRGLHRPEYI